MENLNISTLSALSAEDQFYLLASHMPTGRFWEGCFNPNTNLGKLTQALSIEYYRLGILLENLTFDYNIRNTNQLMIEWEESCGIPQECFSRNESLSVRRKNIEGMFSNYAGVQTNEDYVRIGALYGYNISVYAGIDTTSVISFPTEKEAKFTVVINLNDIPGNINVFPLEFPHPFFGFVVGLLDCIFKLVTPANVNVYITNALN